MPQGAFLKGIPSLRARDQSLNCERSRALFRYPIVSSSLILPGSSINVQMRRKKLRDLKEKWQIKSPINLIFYPTLIQNQCVKIVFTWA